MAGYFTMMWSYLILGCLTALILLPNNINTAEYFDDDEGEALKVVAFNVRKFGQAKAANSDVMAILVKVILRFDIVLIQEVTDTSGKAIDILWNAVNEAAPEGDYGGMYDLKLSPRLGRTQSTEQYAYLYRSDKLSAQRSYVYNDVDDIFERDPFIVVFDVLNRKRGLKRLSVAGIHTKPTDAVKELQGLSLVSDDMVSKGKSSNTVIMGDFNAGCTYVRKKHWNAIPLWTESSRFEWVIGHDKDTTTTTTICPYDRIVITGNQLKKALLRDRSGVFEFDQEYGLNNNQTLDVSDHYPVYMTLKI